MATHPDYPRASSRNLRGKIAWRVLLPVSRKQVTLPGAPGDEEFDYAYHAAMRPKSAAEVLNAPGRALPRTFGKAARLLENTAEWIGFSKPYQDYSAKFLERFMNMQVRPDAPLKWRDVPVEMMGYNDLNDIIMSIYQHKPQTGRHFLIAIKKLFKVALDQKWIGPMQDVSAAIKLRKPKHKPNPKWPQDIMDKFEARHPIGSSAHTCYSLAKWLGNRRSDIAPLGWDQLVQIEIEDDDGDLQLVDVFEFRQKKNETRTGGKAMTLPIPDPLAAVLNALTRQPGKTVLQRFDGEAYSEKSLTNQMATWCEQAGIPAGYTMHGLRRTFAHNLAKAKTPVTVIRDMMGHDEIGTTQIYLDEIDRNESALEARDAVNAREAKRSAAKRRANLRIVG